MHSDQTFQEKRVVRTELHIQVKKCYKGNKNSHESYLEAVSDWLPSDVLFAAVSAVVSDHHRVLALPEDQLGAVLVEVVEDRPHLREQ